MTGYLITRLPIDQTPSLDGWPNDLTGLKLHVAGMNSPERAAAAAEFQARGAIPIYLPNAEVPAALNAGVVDASWHPSSRAGTVDQILSQHDFYAYAVADDGSLTLYAEGGSVEPPPPVDPAVGTDGDDRFQSTNDASDGVFDGRQGRDMVAYQGAREQYTFEHGPNGTILVIKPGGGIDTLSSIERLKFSDQGYNLEVRANAATIPESALDALIDLYIAYFNRVPEASGLDYWIDQYKAGQTLDQIAVQFYAAGVTFGRITGYSADMPLADFVAIVYQNVLDRTGANAPSQTELDYWINQVGSGNVTREGLVKQVLTDARQFYDDPAVGYVPTLLDNKVELGKLHAVTYGVDYLSDADAIRITSRLADAVTPTSIDAAVDVIGIGEGNYFA